MNYRQKCKTRNDLTKNVVNMEVMLIELHGRNKNTPYLVAVAYQPSPYESDKLLWLETLKYYFLKWQPSGMVLSL